LASYFFDSSALVKLYHAEAGSLAVEKLLVEPGREIFISRLSEVELHSAIGGKLRVGTITAEQAEVLGERFDGDLADGEFRLAGVSSSHFGTARKLIRRFAASHGLRTLDALQLAVALDLHRGGVIDYLVSSDKILCRVAALEGLSVIDPEAGAV
jgi:predicted nucleic acid-binding protein